MPVGIRVSSRGCVTGLTHPYAVGTVPMAHPTQQSLIAVVFILVFVAAMGLPCGPARGEDFRVENKVFVGGDSEPKIQSSTIFYEGVVYDFLEKPREITVFDKARKRFVLLDPARRLRTDVSTDEVEALNHNLKVWAVSQRDATVRFLGNPKFEESVDAKTGALVFDSPWVTYRVAAEPAASEEIARQYREFSDWYIQLNARLHPGYKQTFARLIVNEALEKRKAVPREVHLTIKSKLPFQKTTARSEHQLIRRLLQSDRDRVAQTDEFMAIFQPVAFEQYQKKLEP